MKYYAPRVRLCTTMAPPMHDYAWRLCKTMATMAKCTIMATMDDYGRSWTTMDDYDDYKPWATI